MKIITVNVSQYFSLLEFQNKTKDMAGVYLVYRINRENKKYRLIYIGKSDDISSRVGENHEHFQDWLAYGYDKVDNLKFSWICIPNDADIDLCEAALIYKFQPAINTQLIESYMYEDVTIFFKGRNLCGRSMIIVQG